MLSKEELAICLIGALVLIGVLIPFQTKELSNEGISFEVVRKPTSSLEIGEIETKIEGTNGLRQVTKRVTGNMIQRFFAPETLDKTTLSSIKIRSPKNEVLGVGTKKYQYMHCSNGSYRYYSDKDFKKSGIGFTSKSPDYCKKTGNGYRTRLANTPQVSKPRCIDVTSYDYNWNNDVLCTRSDGTQYYTSYSGAGW